MPITELIETRMQGAGHPAGCRQIARFRDLGHSARDTGLPLIGCHPDHGDSRGKPSPRRPTPSTENRTVPPRRVENGRRRPREYLTVKEILKLIDGARGARTEALSMIGFQILKWLKQIVWDYSRRDRAPDLDETNPTTNQVRLLPPRSIRVTSAAYLTVRKRCGSKHMNKRVDSFAVACTLRCKAWV